MTEDGIFNDGEGLRVRERERASGRRRRKWEVSLN